MGRRSSSSGSSSRRSRSRGGRKASSTSSSSRSRGRGRRSRVSKADRRGGRSDASGPASRGQQVAASGKSDGGIHGVAVASASVTADTRGSGDIQGGAECDVAVVRRAAALRTKYKKHQSLLRIPVMQIGAHPDNRDGQGPSGSRCLELTSNILLVGYDVVEADSNGVLVEQKPGSAHICDTNRRFADGDELLAPIVDGQISYGTLSHSTLNQLLRNIHARCPVVAGGVASEVLPSEGPSPAVAVDEVLSRIVDTTGRLSSAMLQQVDPSFGNAVHSGLLWEVLSHVIEAEEPDGCAVIQSALNAKNGLFLVTHEMQALSRLMTLTASSAVAEARMSWEFVLSRVRQTMAEFARDKNFIDLYSFVVDLGGQQSSFLADLKSFHQRFVNPQLRRLRLDSFAAANALPFEMPHLKVALLKHLYVDARLSNGYCTPLSMKLMKTMAEDPEGRAASAVAEEVLRFFHVDCAVVLKKLEGGLKIKLLGNLDKDVFGKLTQTANAASRDAAVRACGGSYHKRLVRLSPSGGVPEFPFSHEHGICGDGASGTVALQPRVIEYDRTGRPLTKQQAISRTGVEEVFGWSTFMRTSTVVDAIDETCTKSLILSHLLLLHKQLPRVSEDDIKLVKSGGKISVVALRAMEAGALRLAPLVYGGASLSRLSQGTSATYVLKVRVLRDGVSSDWLLTGGAALPNASAVAEDNKGTVSQHSWLPHHTPWPLWCVKRVSEASGTNCDFQDVDIRCVSTFAAAGGSEPTADNCDITLPVLVNKSALAAGEELRVLWAPRAVPRTEKPSVTWAVQARNKLSKQQPKVQ